jgi:ubiquitin-protein ligase E3 C
MMLILPIFPFQAIIDGTKANDIMNRAPFLVPFTSRVKIFNVSLVTKLHSKECEAVRNKVSV